MSVYITERWRESRQGRPIALHASGDLTRADHPLLLIGGVHGDEPEGVVLAESTLSYLRAEADRVALPWIVIPCLNPDGRRANQRVNGAGVDLNRNYPSRDWSPAFEKDRYNPGPRPASEPEIQGVVELIEAYDPRLVIHCHAWRPCVVSAGLPGRRDAERLGRASGYEVREEIGYPTPGSLSRYGWADRGIPIICIEEAETTPPERIWGHFEAGMREIFADPSPRRAAV